MAEDDEPETVHVPVLLPELMQSLCIRSQGTYVDATAGYGGHARQLWSQLGSDGMLILCDRDEEAVRYLRNLFTDLRNQRLRKGEEPPHFLVMHQRFSRLDAALKDLGCWGKVQGLYGDLGVSSPQLDSGHRGFSFQRDGPVDMRMDFSEGQSASEYLRQVSEEELTAVLRRLGEEPRARAVARGIVAYRSKPRCFESTVELADVIRRASGYRHSRRHPATRTFQAIRMQINGELAELEALLQWGFHALAPGGRMAFIAFHSLEDSRVKRCMKELTAPPSLRRPHHREFAVSAPDINRSPSARLIKPFPTRPSEAEEAANPRCRSARLRCVEKL